jgi:hypothetical protein
VMLETYELRDSLRGARKEVAQSLYIYDAACRTIARLTQEKESAQKALEDLKTQLTEVQANPPAQGVAEGPEGPPSKRVRAHLPLNRAARRYIASLTPLTANVL